MKKNYIWDAIDTSKIKGDKYVPSSRIVKEKNKRATKKKTKHAFVHKNNQVKKNKAFMREYYERINFIKSI